MLKANGLTVQKLSLKRLRRPEDPAGRVWVKRAFRLHSCFPVLGLTDRSTVMLDFDKTSFKTVQYYAFRIMRWFRLEGFIILKSSRKCYHVVFDRKVTWRKNMRVIAWACFISGFNVPLMRWFVMQCIKGEPTLRVGVKGSKPKPRVVYRFGCQDSGTKEFLKFRREKCYRLDK